MLYKLESAEGRFVGIERMAFRDFASFGQREKHLEDLIAQNLLEVLFEEAGLMPVFQERQGQQVADIYAVNAMGELTIFELKVGTAGAGAVHQALGYAQDAGQWSHAELQERYRGFAGPESDLAEAHHEAFGLDRPLPAGAFNRRQHLIVIGSAADDGLINAVEYWRGQGISLDFLPYRIYELAGERYFEFFALPYDRHRNPADEKGRGVRYEPKLGRGIDLVHDGERSGRGVRGGQALRRVREYRRHRVLLPPVDGGRRCGGGQARFGPGRWRGHALPRRGVHHARTAARVRSEGHAVRKGFGGDRKELLLGAHDQAPVPLEGRSGSLGGSVEVVPGTDG